MGTYNEERRITGKGTWYVAAIFPVKLTTKPQMKKPAKVSGMTSRAVKPIDMAVEMVDQRGG